MGLWLRAATRIAEADRDLGLSKSLAGLTMKSLFTFSVRQCLLLLLTSSVFAQEAGSSLADVLKIVGYRAASMEAGVVSSETVSFHYPATTGAENSSTPYRKVRSGFLDRTEDLSGTADPSEVFSDLLAGFDMEVWDKVSQFSSTYIYSGERYRRVLEYTPVSEMQTEVLKDVNDARFTQLAFDGVFQFALSNRKLRVDLPDGRTFGQGPSEWPLLLMRWDMIPEQNLVRADQELRTGYLDKDRYEYTLADTETKAYTEQIFNTSTGLVERITGFASNGQMYEEAIWAAPRRHPSGIWTPVFYLHVWADDTGQHDVIMKVYKDWDLRPVEDAELVIPSSDYDVIKYATRTRMGSEANLQEAIRFVKENLRQESVTPSTAVVTSAESLNGPNPAYVTSGGNGDVRRRSPIMVAIYVLGGFLLVSGLVLTVWPKKQPKKQ